jgi:Ca2+-binding RTX toxin-like protein
LAEGNEDDDTISATANDADKQTLLGGAGDDSIKFLTANNAGFFTIKGGAGDDTLNHSGAGIAASTYKYLFDSFAEFYSSNDLVDTITTNGGNVNVVHTFEIAGALKFDDADEISNLTNSGTSTTVLATAKSVTSASSVQLDTAEAALFDTIDISAGTTGSSKIDLSESTVAHTIKGSKTGRNTLLGGDASDTITGGSGNDTITGGLLGDVIDFGSGGRDIIVQAEAASVAAADILTNGDEDAAADTDKVGACDFEFTGGLVDIVSGFTADDIINGLGASVTDVSDVTFANVADDTLVVVYGTYDPTATVPIFTGATAFNADSNHDALITVTNDDDHEGFESNSSFILLKDLGAALADTNFTA